MISEELWKYMYNSVFAIYLPPDSADTILPNTSAKVNPIRFIARDGKTNENDKIAESIIDKLFSLLLGIFFSTFLARIVKKLLIEIAR